MEWTHFCALGGRYQGVKPSPTKYASTALFTPDPSTLSTAPVQQVYHFATGPKATGVSNPTDLFIKLHPSQAWPGVSQQPSGLPAESADQPSQNQL